MRNVLVTGAHGFLGKPLVEELKENGEGIENILTFRSSEYNLLDKQAIVQLLHDKKPDTVIHLAATVGGIGANMKNPGTFFYNNLMMGVELIEQSRLAGIEKFVAIGTICSYPKHTPVPFRESEFWNGYPEETNAPYGLAKKMLTVQLEAYRKQFGFRGITLLPVNLYGPGDNFDLESSHVIPAMIRKFHTARTLGLDSVVLWGDGSPSREFLYVDDAARGIRLAAQHYDSPDPVNLGSGQEIEMKKLATTIKNVVGYEGEIVWDTTRPNGQPRRCPDVTRARDFGFSANVSLRMGLDLTYDWFLKNFEEKDFVADRQAAAERLKQ